MGIASYSDHLTESKSVYTINLHSMLYINVPGDGTLDGRSLRYNWRDMASESTTSRGWNYNNDV